MSDARDKAEREAFEAHDAPSWQVDPEARDAAVRWHFRGFEAGAEWQASRPVTDAEVRLYDRLTTLLPITAAEVEAAARAMSAELPDEPMWSCVVIARRALEAAAAIRNPEEGSTHGD